MLVEKQTIALRRLGRDASPYQKKQEFPPGRALAPSSAAVPDEEAISALPRTRRATARPPYQNTHMRFLKVGRGARLQRYAQRCGQVPAEPSCLALLWDASAKNT